jgi:hypothetical protein
VRLVWDRQQSIYKLFRRSSQWNIPELIDIATTQFTCAVLTRLGKGYTDYKAMPYDFSLLDYWSALRGL